MSIEVFMEALDGEAVDGNIMMLLKKADSAKGKYKD
jgi:hypothetical protein